jgi:long-chain acyl-CoA synthetase
MAERAANPAAAALLRGRLLGDGQRPALLHGSRELSRADLAALTDRLANELAVLEPGSLVATWLSNGPELLALYVACFARRLVPMPLAPGLKWPELQRAVQSARPEALIVAASSMKAHSDAVVQLAPRIWTVAQDGTLQVLASSPRAGAASLAMFSSPSPDEAPCLVLHTSGSTGRPKGVVLPRRAVQHILDYRLAHCELRTESVSVVASCVAQSVGLYQSLALLAAGARFVLLDSYEVESMVTAVNEHHPSHLILVVSALDQLLHHPRLRPEALRQLRFAAAGADRLTPRVQQRFAALTGLPLRASYGLSESSWALVNDGTQPAKALALGTPSADVSIELRANDGSCVELGEIGEIHIRSPRTLLGYLNDPELSNQVLRDGWLATGDLAYQDAEGYYWFAGRSKDLIVLASGDNVSPTEIEEVLRAHPAVKACVVTARTENGSLVPWAFVVAHHPITARALHDFLAQRLSDFKLPATIELVDELPLGSSGKIQRTRN